MNTQSNKEIHYRVALSTGIGRLHLVEAASRLKKFGHDVDLIQGWVPTNLPDPLLNAVGRFVGSPNLATGLRKRVPSNFSKDRIAQCASAEFIAQALRIASRLKLIEHGAGARIGWKLFGSSTKKYIDGQEVFHVRSGAGQGGAIERAKSMGAAVVVDHSIAHPAFMENVLADEYSACGVKFWLGPSNPFWELVLDDCMAADILLVNSNFVKETFVSEGYAPERVHVAYQGTRDDFFDLKRSYARGEGCKLLFTGAFGFRKGANYLAEAMRDLSSKKERQFTLDVLGDHSEFDAEELNRMSDYGVRAHGFVPQDDLKTYLASSDIYVFPTLAEGCASSGIEAMAAGLPVVTTRESGLPIVHGESGWLIESKNSGMLGEAIEKLSSDASLREYLGRNGRSVVASSCSWGRYSQSVTKAYEKAIELRNGAPDAD